MARRKRPKITDALNDRTSKTFIGREAQLSLFRDNFSDDIADENLKWIFNIHGQGGVGKTTLSMEYLKITKKKQIKTAFLDLEDNRLQNVPVLLVEIVRQLRLEKVDFPEFDKKYKAFQETIDELSKDEKATPALLNAIVSGTIKTGISELKKIPGGSLLDNFNLDGIADKFGNYSAFLFNKYKDKDKRELVTEPNKVLTSAFLEDIENTEEEFCLIFDTYETAFFSLDEWLRDIHNNQFGEVPNNLFMVISGRDKLSEKWRSFDTITQEILLERFTENEAIAFLKNKNITNETVVKTLIEISARFPVLLVLLSDNPPTSIEEINDVSGDAIERFLKWIKNPEERKVLLAAALPRAINQDMVAELLSVLEIDKSECEKYYNLLNKQPFVQQRGNIKTYHPVVKDQMLKHLFRKSPKTWRKQHDILANYFEAEANELGFETLETPYNNEEWIRLTLEATYHKLCANFEKELPNAVECMAIHLDKTRIKESTINWSQIISEAGKLVDEKKWSSFIQKGLSGYIANDDEIALEFFEKMVIKNWINQPLAKALFYSIIALYSQKAKNYKKAIINYTKAIKLNPNDIITYNNIALAYLENKNIPLAEHNYHEALNINPNYALTLNNLGLLVLNEYDNSELAINYFKKAAAHETNSIKANYNLGVVYQRMNEINEAIKFFQFEIKKNPSYANSYYNLGIIFFFKEKIDKALDLFISTITYDDCNILAYINIGYIYIRKLEYEKANKYIQQAWELSNLKNEFAAKNIAHLSLLQEDKEIAIEKYKAAILLWESLEEYLEQLESDYEHLLLEEKGISKVAYEAILEELKREL